MNLTVRVFAAYADAIGSDHAVISVAEPATVGSIRLAIAALSTRLPPRPLIAVNETYATDDVPVHSGDEIAVIPPVAGG
jgi:molybdopterin converting factor small subunit